MNKYEKHHYPPESRGGHHIVKTPKSFHRSWHILFEDLYSWETVLCAMDVQALCNQCKRGELPKFLVAQTREELKKMSRVPPFLKHQEKINWFYSQYITEDPVKKYYRLPKVYDNAWDVVFRNLRKNEVIAFIIRLQHHFNYTSGKLKKRQVEGLRKNVKKNPFLNIKEVLN